MTMFYNLTQAPSVLIEELPSNTVLASAYKRKIGSSDPQEVLTIEIHAPRSSGLLAKGTIADDDFVEEYCYQCDYHCESIEVDLGDHDIEVEDSQYGTLYLYSGTGYSSSPCPCYDDGLGSVEWPCPAGHEDPSDSEEDADNLNGSYLCYAVHRQLTDFSYEDASAWQQGHRFDEDSNLRVTMPERICNTFDNDFNRICWGNNRAPRSLLMVEQVFSQAHANQDLLTYDSHQQNAEYIQEQVDDEDEGMDINKTLVPMSYRNTSQALAVAVATHDQNAFMLMTVSGCITNEGTAYVPVYQYKQVAVDEDTIVDVWVTNELSSGCRLMFYQNQLLGQIPNNFDLTPCKSLNVSSSGAEELVNS